MNEKVYRYESLVFGGDRVEVYLRYFNIIRKTALGVWIDLGFGQEKLIFPLARKKFAALTKEEALESFHARKRKQIKILKNQLDIAEKALIAIPIEQEIT